MSVRKTVITPRETLNREILRLQVELLALGESVGSAILDAVSQLVQRDRIGAKALVAADSRINRHRYLLEQDVLTAVALHQPVARDVRLLGAILETAIELERIGDYAKGIGDITLRRGEQPMLEIPAAIPAMATKTVDMLQRALAAFVDQDADTARLIPDEDDAVDELYNQVFRTVIAHTARDAGLVEQANYLLWCAHNLERAADRVGNICERVVFTVTGELVELDIKVPSSMDR